MFIFIGRFLEQRAYKLHTIEQHLCLCNIVSFLCILLRSILGRCFLSFCDSWVGQTMSFLLWKQGAVSITYLCKVIVQTLFVKRPEQLQTSLSNYFQWSQVLENSDLIILLTMGGTWKSFGLWKYYIQIYPSRQGIQAQKQRPGNSVWNCPIIYHAVAKRILILAFRIAVMCLTILCLYQQVSWLIVNWNFSVYCTI